MLEIASVAALLRNDENNKEYYSMSKYSKRAASSGSSSRTEFNPDYTNVKRDLRRIGTLAGSFFVILVVLSFFLK